MYTYLCMGDGSASVATNVETRKKPDCGDKNPECLPSKLKMLGCLMLDLMISLD